MPGRFLGNLYYSKIGAGLCSQVPICSLGLLGNRSFLAPNSKVYFKEGTRSAAESYLILVYLIVIVSIM